uniref:BOD1/SHG1 domain-containing protein n=1 Tax=Kalanchoe fedtschenkoi TaxID=63787 RepID=A0A7N0TX62_KALFE
MEKDQKREPNKLVKKIKNQTSIGFVEPNFPAGSDMENGHRVITKEEVIAKLKDDGDFDRLRLEIIRRLKDNDELRNSIATVVKQSAVLNQAGSENMKPRQLSDAIREDVGDTLMSQLSDGVWEIIRDEDGMQKEIKETIQCVHNKMVNPNYKEEGASSPSHSVLPTQNEAVNSSLPSSVNKADGTMSDNDPSEPPGFSLGLNNFEESLKEGSHISLPKGRNLEEQKNEKHNESRDTTKHNDETAPLVSQGKQLTHLADCSDEDPDLPPGFG